MDQADESPRNQSYTVYTQAAEAYDWIVAEEPNEGKNIGKELGRGISA